ncbi:MAG: hypothetical protein D9V47_09550 [Clostridia bacterium]|nr:MAG: hypothetical protein D9V47_09550 [Clostridia bacterium]
MAVPKPGLAGKLAGIQVKVTHVIIAALCAALGTVVWFGWMYVNKTSPVETVQAAVAPVTARPRWVATVYGEGDVFLNQPRSVYVHSNQIYVSDTSNHRVVVFDYNGRYVRKFGDTGDEKTRLAFPYGVAVVGGEVFVADAGLMKVAVFDAAGNFLRYFGEDVLKKPVNIVYQDGKLYFTDVVRQQVVVMDTAGKELLSIGKPGQKEPGEFHYPNGLAVAPDGRIFVADTNNSRVQIFDPDGKFLAIWQGDVAKAQGYFAAPTNIALDKAGNVYVADPLTRRVAVVDKDGNMLGAVEQAGPPEQGETLSLPSGVYVDGRQRLFVADYGGSCVAIYDLK